MRFINGDILKDAISEFLGFTCSVCYFFASSFLTMILSIAP
jgi:hypothetical protein